MHGKNLSTYHRNCVELCSLAQVDPDGKAQIDLFLKNLNNNATSGGLCTQVITYKDKPGVGHVEINRFCDQLIPADSGTPDYESMDISGMGRKPSHPKSESTTSGLMLQGGGDQRWTKVTR